MKRAPILEALESVIGETLTPAVAGRLAQAPGEQVRELLERLAPYYGIPISGLIDDYFDPYGEGDRVHFSIDPEVLASEYVNAEEIQRFQNVAGQFKNVLLYVDRVALPDPFDFVFARPLADLINGTDEVNAFYGESDDMLAEAWSNAIRFLSTFAPLLRAGIVELVPYRWLSDFTVTNRAMLQAAVGESFGEDALIVPHGMDTVHDVRAVITALGSPEEGNAIADAMALYEILSNLRLIPLARTRAGLRTLEIITSLEQIALGGQIGAAATGALVQNQLPGVAQIPFEMVVAIRQDDEAFDAWRASFTQVMAQATSLPFKSEAQYRADLAEAADDLLKPKIAAIEKSLRGTNVFNDLFRPNATQIGVGGIIALATHTAGWGVLGTAATAIAKYGWAVAKRKFGNPVRESETLRDLYAYVVTAPKLG